MRMGQMRILVRVRGSKGHADVETVDDDRVIVVTVSGDS